MIIDLTNPDPTMRVHDRPGELVLRFWTRKADDEYRRVTPGIESIQDGEAGLKCVTVRPPLFDPTRLRNELWVIDCAVREKPGGKFVEREYQFEVRFACSANPCVIMRHAALSIEFRSEPFTPWDGRAVVAGPDAPTVYDRLRSADLISETRM